VHVHGHIVFSVMSTASLSDAFRGDDDGIYTNYWSGGRTFNLRRLQEEHPYAGCYPRFHLRWCDCALNRFSNASDNFGLIINTKTSTLCISQPPPRKVVEINVTSMWRDWIYVVDKFTYSRVVHTDDLHWRIAYV